MKIWFILSLLTAFFASLKDVFSKTALDSAGACLIAWFWSVGALPFLLPFLLVVEIPEVNKEFCAALVLLFQMYAISIVQVPYVIAIKRSSVLISVGFGYLLFGEKKIRQRSIGAACMCAGVVIIALFS